VARGGRRAGRTGAIPAIDAVASDPAAGRDDRVAAVDALADLSDAAGLPALVRALASADPEVRLHAAWAIGSVASMMVRLDAAGADRDPRFEAAEEAVAAALPGLDREAACAYLEVFPKVADGRLTAALLELARRTALAGHCERVERRPRVGRPEAVVADAALVDAWLAAVTAIAGATRVSRGSWPRRPRTRVRRRHPGEARELAGRMR